MKLKGVGIIEQHIEKAVLGVVVLVFVAVLAMQFVGGGNKVKVDKQNYPIQRGYDPIAKRAQEVGLRMRDSNPSVLPKAVPLGLSTQWAKARDSLGSGGERLAAIAPRFGPGAGAGTRGGADLTATSGEYTYAPIVVPAPRAPVGLSVRSTLDPIAVAMNRDLENICRAQGLTGQPWDASAVTIQTTFNGAALAQSLAKDPDGEGTRYAAIPEAWWRGNVEILEVQFEVCNGFDPAGNPINPRPVAPLPRPGSEPLTRRIPAQNPTVEQVQAVVERAGDIRSTIQPDYFRTIAGEPWKTPIERARLAAIEAKRPEIDRKVRQYEEAVRQVERDERALVEAAGPRAGNPGPGGPGGGGRGEQGNRPPDQPTPAGPNESQIRQLRDKLQRSIKDRDALLAGLNVLGVTEKGEPLPLGDASDIDALADMLEMAEVYAWSHDLLVRPGDVRRYRARVIVNNPLFGYGRQLAEEQRSLATEPTLASAWSGWSEPVEIEGTEYYYVTSASEGATDTDPTDMPRVGVEVFKFYYGYWRQGTASLEPGDQLAADIRLPDPALLPIYDVSNIRNVAPPPPGQGPSRPGMQGPPGANQGQPGSGAPGTGPNAPQLPAGASPGPDRIGFAVEAWLLDVGSVAGGGDPRLQGSRARLQAYMRDKSGTIVVRPTGEQLSSDRYKAMVLSAKEGQDQGAEDPKAEPPPRPEPPPRDPGRDTPRPPPGGGGGGGGGGG